MKPEQIVGYQLRAKFRRDTWDLPPLSFPYNR